MKLYMASASPFVRKVRVALRELQLDSQIQEIPVATTPLDTDPGVAAANPLGKIPSLARDDGPTLYDSRVITRYLDHIASGTLYPQTSAFEILTLEATADGIMEAAVSMIYEVRLRPEANVSDAWLTAQWGKIEQALDAVQGRWMGHLTGPLNIGQIGIACALGYLDLRHDARGWRNGRPTLDAWYEAFAQRDSFLATMPQG